MRKKFTIIGLLALILVVMMGFASYEVSAQSDGCGLDEIDAGDYDAAIQVCTTYIGSNPNDATAYYDRGYAYYMNAEDELAVADFTTSLGLDPNNDVVFYYRGRSNLYLKNNESAAEDMLNAIELSAEPNEYYHYYLGNAYYNQKMYKKAITEYQNAIDIYPDYPEAFAGLGDSYYFLGDANTSIDYFTKALDLSPEYGYAFYGRGYSFLKAEADREAINDFVNALIYLEDYDKKFEIQNTMSDIIDSYIPAG